MRGSIPFFKLILAIAAAGLSAAAISGQAGSNGFPVLKGPYLGQNPPGTTPEIFPPAALRANQDWFWHGSPAFSPDMREILFVKYFRGKNFTEIHRMTATADGVWSAPEKAAFSEAQYRDNNPFHSGPETLLFYSARFRRALVRIEKRGDPGSQPSAMPLVIPPGLILGKQFSLTRSGVLYGELWKSDDSDADLYRWAPSEGAFAAPEPLSGEVNSPAFDFNPFVSPDETILLFSSQRPGGLGKTDLYVSFKNSDGTWSPAVNLGPAFNSPENESFASISPDGKYIFFCREGEFGSDPYWADIRALDPLRPRAPGGAGD